MIEWISNHNLFNVKVINICHEPGELKDVDAAWVHIHDKPVYDKWSTHLPEITELKKYYKTGGKLFLSNFAALFPAALGIEPLKPEIRTLHIKDDGLFDEKGLQSFRGHPVFKDLFGGSFIWDSYENHELPIIGYFNDDFPQSGKVVATGKSYVTVNENHRLMVEYQEGQGKILSIGAFIYFSKDNRLKLHLEKFIENSLLYLVGENVKEPITYWQKYDNKPREFSISTKSLKKSSERLLKNLPQTELVFKNDNPQDNFFDIAGQRALVMGKENSGIDELWVHPFRVLRNFQTGIVVKNKVVWLNHLPVKIELRPESLTRIYQTEYGKLKEVIYPSLSRAGAIVHYEANISKPVKLMVKFRSELRWMWPYAENALGDLYFGYDEGLNALHVKDTSSDFYCIIGADLEPNQYISGQYSDITWKSNEFTKTKTDLNQVYHACLYELNSENDYVLNIAIVGTNEGKENALNDYRYLLCHPEQVYSILTKHYQNLLETKLTIESPDEEFNKLWKWTLVGTDRFLVKTPPLGTALVAGFSTTERGWDGGHKINGRPGYGWYFGRDSEWSCFAIDDYGDFELVKKQLEFLQKYQDISGKIFHEISTSGVVHFDAADATPLYIILAAHYLRASGDIEFVKKSWHHIKKAIDFLYSTDTDGDLLIENTNVGHGWVEGGKLWGANSTFYLSGLWTQALKDAAYIASLLKKEKLSEKYSIDAIQIEKILNTDFWNESTQFYNYGKFSNGKFNPEKTILPAVVMYYNLLDDEKVDLVLDDYAENGFSSDWGVRILSSESLLFNPRGYHEGSVWPLFTGWTALAEYRYGNSTQGFMHIMNNLYIKNHWALGYVEEVMNGAVYKPSGVCPHQCWSETNILHPAITGMIGWKPDAPAKSAELSPRFPWHWNKVKINNLHAGKTVLQLQMERTKTSTNYEFDLSKGPNIKLHFKPEIPDGMIIQEAKLNAGTIEVNPYTKRGLLAEPISFILKDHIEITFYHHGGIGMIPLMPQPMPGESSKGYRIIDTTLEGKRYIVELQGKANTIGTFEIMIFDQSVKSVKGAQIKSLSENGVMKLEVPFHQSRQKFVSTSVILEFD
ncbi:MAG: hypothetical protein KAW56_10835 [Candidatus Marinimicrobia bacterium]|nr:hypothetical protein [Candidatus Neomarinimicrobiota bacterium]